MHKRAMTLVELVVVVIIVGILSLSAAGSFSQVNARRFKNELQLIVADISLARELAATRHQAYSVNFNASNDSYVVCNANVTSPCNCCNVSGCRATCSCCIMGQAGSGRSLASELKSAPLWVKFSPPLGMVSFNSATPSAINIKRSNSSTSPSANIVINGNTGYVYIE